MHKNNKVKQNKSLYLGVSKSYKAFLKFDSVEKMSNAENLVELFMEEGIA